MVSFDPDTAGLTASKAVPLELGNVVVSFIDGSLFAIGLGVSGMTSPTKVDPPPH